MRFDQSNCFLEVIDMSNKTIRETPHDCREDIVHGVFFAAASVFVAGVVLAMLL